MHCPFCFHSDTRVIDSRPINETNTIKRRRKCESCQKKFNTFERVEINMPMVIKNDGRREYFDSQKIFLGIQKACQKRPVSVGQIKKIIDYIEKTIVELNDNEVSAKEIGKLVMNSIRDLDPVAYVRFASVYKTFKDVDDFIKDLKIHYNNEFKNNNYNNEI